MLIIGAITLVLATNHVAEELATIAKKAHFTVWLLYKQNYCKSHQGNLSPQHKYYVIQTTGKSPAEVCEVLTENHDPK